MGFETAPYKQERFSTLSPLAHERRRKPAKALVQLCAYMHAIIQQSGIANRQKLQEEIGFCEFAEPGAVAEFAEQRAGTTGLRLFRT